MDNEFVFSPEQPKIASFFVDILQTIVIALAITVVIYLFIATPHQVDGSSMEENFYNNELLLTNKIIQIIGDTSIGDKLNYDYKRGDVIIFKQPDKPDFIKRIVAEPNDTIMIKDSKLIINDMAVEEFYIPNSPGFKIELPDEDIAFLTEGQKRRVPENKYFVMGDNRQHSQDSRYSTVGWVDRSEIKGKVFLRYWPLDRFGLIGSGSYEEESYVSN